MSMNLYIYASRKIIVVKTGKEDYQYAKVSVWQTPTEVTHKILNSEDPLEAYKDWVFSITDWEETPVYADDDFFNADEPIRYEPVHPGKTHIEELETCVRNLLSEGYELEFSEI